MWFKCRQEWGTTSQLASFADRFGAYSGTPSQAGVFRKRNAVHLWVLIQRITLFTSPTRQQLVGGRGTARPCDLCWPFIACWTIPSIRAALASPITPVNNCLNASLAARGRSRCVYSTDGGRAALALTRPQTKHNRVQQPHLARGWWGTKRFGSRIDSRKRLVGSIFVAREKKGGTPLHNSKQIRLGN